MITRDVADERAILIQQGDHADLAAQFAAHWGNADFFPSDCHTSVVAAATYHDDHFRDIESLLPIDLNQGRPFGHRTMPFSPAHIEALQQNIDWVDKRDRYAALLVSMHHSGLPQNRYGVINSWQNAGGKSPSSRPLRPELAATIEKMERSQRAVVQELGQDVAQIEKKLWFNYRLLQVFDLLSLYLCCDGYDDNGLREITLGPVPVAPGSDREVSIRIIPGDAGSVRMDPYPLDSFPLKVSVVARVVPRLVGAPEEECRAAYVRSSRECLSWLITK